MCQNDTLKVTHEAEFLRKLLILFRTSNGIASAHCRAGYLLSPKGQRMTTTEMMNDGPTVGTARLYAAVREGKVTEAQFMECIQELVFQSLMGIEDMEEEEASI